MMNRKVILSASTLTGNLTIGNYIGAINNWKQLQEEYQCYYMIADLHGLTQQQDPKIFLERGYSFFAQYIALGLDYNKNTLFIQSHVSEHAELAWILNCFTPIGNLNRMTQFKDKSKLQKSINVGLFCYPVLMASDILLYDSSVVPVGEDQMQHLELCRDIVKWFNNRYSKTFITPEAYVGKQGSRIMSLTDPKKKMSKSDDNESSFISIIDPLNKISKKIKSATTDSGEIIKSDPAKQGITNLLVIYSCLSGKSIEKLEQEYQGKMYGHLKSDLAELVCETLKPIQERYKEVISDKGELTRIIKEGALKAKERAHNTLNRVYKNIGLITYL